MSYDLRRMRLHGLIERTPRTNTYTVTAEGIRVAVFYTKLQARLLEPLLEADKPPAPLELRRALSLSLIHISRVESKVVEVGSACTWPTDPLGTTQSGHQSRTLIPCAWSSPTRRCIPETPPNLLLGVALPKVACH